MARSLTMRATSLAASTALLAIAAVAAFSLKWVVASLATAEPPPFLSVNAPAAPSPPSHSARHIRLPDLTNTAQSSLEPLDTFPISTSSDSVDGAVPDPRPPTISSPSWLQMPHDLARYYPATALRREIEGEVQLDCLVTTTGALQCTVASESPANWGFASAAIRISRDYRMAPATRDGAPVEARYRMRVPFRLNH